MSSSGPKVDSFAFPTPVGSPVFGYTQVYNWKYDALLVSQSNFILPSGAWSGGGSFYCWKSSCSHSKEFNFPLSVGTFQLGPFTCMGVVPCQTGPPNPMPVPDWASRDSDLQGHYAKGYNRTRPGNPVASVGQFLIELRDLPHIPLLGKRGSRGQRGGGKYSFKTVNTTFRDLPKRLRENLTSFQNLGSEYLNVVFGWRPFISDLRKMYYLWQSVDKQLGKIIRENGRGINRRATIEDDSTSVPTSQDFSYPFANVLGGPPAFFAGTTSYSSTVTTSRKVWFSAKYRYWIPDVSSSQWDLRARAALFGAIPGPDLLWEVLPWSWLVDWFENVGDVMSNMSLNAVENLVCLHSYTMEHLETKTESTAHVNVAASNPGDVFVHPDCDQDFRSVTKTESKIRRGGGNPYGLSADISSLSGGQLGILAALGISKSKVSPM